MAITYGNVNRHGPFVTVNVTSSLTGTIYYHWYRDGAWIGMTRDARLILYVPPDEQHEIVCQDTNNVAYDGPANAPDGRPPTLTVVWTASACTDIDYYKIERKEGAGEWARVGVLSDGPWFFRWATARLTDLASYQWRITPVDTSGNEGTALELDAVKIVRTPDAVDWKYTYSSVVNRVTFIAA